MITVNAIGDTCPIPVVKTKKAIEALTQPDTVETLVDNEVAVENLKKMAAQKGYSCDSSKLDDGSYSVKLTIEAVNADERFRIQTKLHSIHAGRLQITGSL